jgi:hypothetical protein
MLTKRSIVAGIAPGYTVFGGMLMNTVFVDDREMSNNDTTDNYIQKLSWAHEVIVQYPDGALWFVECGKWTKGNNA